MPLLAPDLTALFSPEVAWGELLSRASVLYLGILVALRIMPRRTGGELATMDLIFILLLAEAASHALGEYTSVADGFVIILTLMAWNYAINALSFRFPFIERLVSTPPLQVIKNGQLQRRNMRREYLTEAELSDHLRKEGIGSVEEVAAAHVEGNGKISIIRRKDAP